MRDLLFASVVRVGQKITVRGSSLGWITLKHCCGVLIGNGVLCRLHFLVLDELVIPICIINISIIPTVVR